MLCLVHYDKNILLQFLSGCQFVCFYIDGVKLYWCQIGTGVKLSLFALLVSNWYRCQIVPFTLLVSNCPLHTLGVKLTPVSNRPLYTLGVKLVRCQIDSGVKLVPVSNWCRCQIVLQSWCWYWWCYWYWYWYSYIDELEIYLWRSRGNMFSAHLRGPIRRFGGGRGQEFATAYSIQYWSSGSWHTYKNLTGHSVMTGNENTWEASVQQLVPPIVASRVRVLPRSRHPRTVSNFWQWKWWIQWRGWR